MVTKAVLLYYVWRWFDSVTDNLVLPFDHLWCSVHQREATPTVLYVRYAMHKLDTN